MNTPRMEYTMSIEDRLPPPGDIDVLRRLGERVGSLASNAAMEEKRTLWKSLNTLHAGRPMVMVETSGVLDEVLPVSNLVCRDPWAQSVERSLRDKLLHMEQIRDDTVVEPWIAYRAVVRTGDYGFSVEKHHAEGKDGLTTYAWKPPVEDIEQALPRLHFRSHELDMEATESERTRLETVFDGILPVVMRGMYWWTTGLTLASIDLIGLEGLMLAMYDQPEALHALIAFLRDDQLSEFDWYEQQGLLFPNNRGDYIGSGGGGYTDELPRPERQQAQRFSVADMWGLSESQETVGVSPEMFAEFVFPYQVPVISRFGLACYGCCEPVDNRWHIIRALPNLRRVSVSPWANLEGMAANLGQSYVYSRKPNPSLISTEDWDEATIVADLRRTMDVAGSLNLELVLKDVHTVAHKPDRLGYWISLVRREIDRISG